MSALTIHAMPGHEAQAREVAEQLRAPVEQINVHHFPDKESLVTVMPTDPTAVVFCSLDRPNTKLVEILLAAAALRSGGATRLILLAPYMCYMRQDAAFQPGQAVSQHAVGRFLSGLFDRIITVDPHLHRQNDIAAVFTDSDAVALSAAPLLACFLRKREDIGNAVLVGPDEESRQWVEAVAKPLGLDALTGQKTRRGDAEVSIVIPEPERVAGRLAILIDDVISTGVTLGRCAKRLIAAGATATEALTVHCLCDENALAMMRQSGIRQIYSTDSVTHSTNAIALAPLLTDALREETAI